MALTATETTKLRNMGIMRATFDTIRVTEATTKGLWHLFNFIQSQGYSGWKWGLREAKALAAYDFDAKDNRPAVTILATNMPVHESEGMYKRLTIYTHHSPINTMQDFAPVGSIHKECHAMSHTGELGGNSLGLMGNWQFTIRFKDDEVAALLREGSLTIRI